MSESVKVSPEHVLFLGQALSWTNTDDKRAVLLAGLRAIFSGYGGEELINSCSIHWNATERGFDVHISMRKDLGVDGKFVAELVAGLVDDEGEHGEFLFANCMVDEYTTVIASAIENGKHQTAET